jgi:Periplasmic copper-binding protein (NosD)
MSYTLRGRVETRLAAASITFVVATVLAGALTAWWPIELAVLMTGVGLALDVALYHRLLAYQPGWLALPLGAVELAILLVVAPRIGIGAPLRPAVALFAVGWLAAQVLGHAVLPLVRLSYAEDGGELGRVGLALGAVLVAAFAFSGGVAWAQRPPTVRLAAGVHQGPIVIRRSERLVGERGAVVRGGIVIASDDVTIRNVTVVGGENGIDVEHADGVVIDHVTVSRAHLDGIHVRDGGVTIRSCTIDSLGSDRAQGIDISFSMSRPPSRVERCTITGGREGIVAHVAHAMLVDNRVSRTSFHAISLTEMSMGEVSRNDVRGGRGVGIYCGDHSVCEIARNVVVDTRPDPSGDQTLAGFGILVHYGSEAALKDNRLVGTRRGVGSILDSQISRR